MEPEVTGQEAIAETEAEAPITPAVDETENLNAPAAETEAQAPEPEEDDSEEFEWEGKQIKGPKGLKDGLLRQQDYTKKTQEVAATRKALAEREEQLAQQARSSEEELSARAKLHGLDDQLKQYENIDWDRWEQEAPLDAQQGWRRLQMLKDQKQEALQDLHQKHNARTEQAKSETTKRLQETDAFARTIPGWTPDTGKQIADYAMSKGIDMPTLEANITPAFYDILHKAWIGEQTLKKQSAAPKAPPMKPLTVVGGKSAPVSKSLAEMDMAEYAAARKRQIAATKGR